GKNLFLSLSDMHKHKFVSEAAALVGQGWKIYATPGTHDYLKVNGVPSSKLHKIVEKVEPSIISAIAKQQIGLMISIPSSIDDSNDAYTIRRLAVDSHVPLITNAETGRLLLRCLADNALVKREVKSWQDYVATPS
ncbi:MAG TPA: hypothetical protein VMR98_00985, partial [Candidatus Polarisedimenticolaceae bacterium]|nr:hypothetical protein [Candidatus Polarisedimenticolaceae bacterium]